MIKNIPNLRANDMDSRFKLSCGKQGCAIIDNFADFDGGAFLAASVLLSAHTGFPIVLSMAAVNQYLQEKVS